MFSALKSITSSVGRLSLGSTIKPQTSSILANSPAAANNFLHPERLSPLFDVPCRGVRRHFKGFRRNSQLFFHYIREKRHHYARAYAIKTTRSKRLKGHIDVYDKEGKREFLLPAVERFKRLDFGAYISTMVGRNNLAHQKTPAQRWRFEQHVFTWHDFWKKLDRMFTHPLKAKRYYVDDPYSKFNKMSFLKYRETLLKNRKLIEKYGNKMYKFDRYRMHMDIIGPFNKPPKELYMPPGFLKTVADNGGAYVPKGDNIVPEPDWMASHFQRTQIRIPDFIDDQKNFKKVGFRLDKDLADIKKAELYYGRLKPWCRTVHKLRY